MCDNDVVISGIGGVFPKSRNLQEFGNMLHENKYLPDKTSRWKCDSRMDVPAVCGTVPHEFFDDLFFGINRKLAKCTDPVSKLGYERSFEAIVDAGLHPQSLRGSNVGVYTAAGVNEFEQKIIFSKPKEDGYSVMGLSRTMFANRISYYFDFNGPSCAMDVSWPAVHLVLERASQAIRSGEANGALVVSSSISRFPQTSYMLKCLGLISEDSLTHSFDENGSGSVRSDAVVAFFLQRADQAKRCYATVLAAAAEYVGPRSTIDITLPSPLGMERFLTNLYKTNSIDPKRLVYVEADGSGHPIRDECELNAIDAALIKPVGHREALLIGSVKPNLGHVDCVNGFAAVCKAIITMETGIIPATINYKTPNSRATGLAEGRIKVVETNTPLQLAKDSVVAVNTMGLAAGMVGHTVLQANPKVPQQPQDPAEHLPRLVPVAGRTEEGVREAVAKIQSTLFDTNFYRLVQDAFSDNIRGYDQRSYVICPPLDKNEVPPVQRVEKRTVWFVYSGMGSQWPGMGKELMKLPVFAETIERLHAILEPRGFDLKNIITETGPNAFDNILKAFLGITACQIALTNVLKALGIVPDGIIGHSVGELGCGYADGCLTEEQTILATCARGEASNAATLIKGMMAAVGLGYKDIKDRLPPSIDVACHNSDSSCTLSGPADDVKEFVQKLSDEGVFARTVNVSDIAYHSRYIQPAGPFLRDYLKEVITEPKKRSAKWVTTSVPLHLRDTKDAQYCSAEYQTNNLLSPVLFEEGLQFIPQQSILIEVAPHGLMQAILKRALPAPMHIPLTQRGNPNPIHFLLNAIGRVSLGGAAPKMSALYPPVSFPVPRGTPSLAQLSSWVHDETTCSDMFNELLDDLTPPMEINNDTQCLKLNQTRLLPLSEKLLLAWQSLTYVLKEPVGTFPVRFDNIHVSFWKNIPKEGSDSIQALCMPGLTEFVVHLLSRQDDKPTEMIRGRMSKVDDDQEQTPSLPAIGPQDMIKLTKDEVYRDMLAKGLSYSPKYQVINAIEMGERDWIITVSHDGSWASFLEAIVQIFFLKNMEDVDEICWPTDIQRIEIDPSKIPKNTEKTLRLNLAAGILVGEGVFVSNVSNQPASNVIELFQKSTPTAMKFVPFGETNLETIDEFLRLTVHAVLESGKDALEIGDLTLLELPNGRKTSELSEAIVSAIKAVTGIKASVVTLTPEGTQPPGFKGRVPLLVTGPATLTEAACALAVGVAGMLLVWSSERFCGSRTSSSIAVLAEQSINGDWLSLVRRAAPLAEDAAVVVEVAAGASPPLNVPAAANKAVVLVWRGLAQDAVGAAIAEVDSRPYAEQARMVFIVDRSAPRFSLREPLYADQLARDARVNVLVDGRWGCWRALPLPPPVNAALSASSLDGVKLQFLGLNPLDVNPEHNKKSLSGHVDYVGTVAHGSRVMGIGQWLADNRRPILDAQLRWPVPDHWSAQEAATVPYVYALAYHSIKVKAEAKCNESILVHEGTSALGQAAIRVAMQLGCSPIFTTVSNAKQREMLLSIFPKLEPAHILTNSNGSFEYRLRALTVGEGVRLVVNTLPDTGLKASLRCLSYWGRLLHYKREDMLAARTIGTQNFLKSVALFGFSGDELFRACERDRRDVVLAMSQGLKQSVVQPIVGATVYNLLDGVHDYRECTKAVIEVDNASPSAREACDPQKSYIVAGGQVTDVLLLASRLSLLGARHILAAVGASDGAPSGALIRQRQRALRRQHGTHLQVQQVRSWDAAAARLVVQAAASVAPVHTALVLTKEEIKVASLMDAALPGDTCLVLLAERAQSACQLASLAEQRRAQGRGTACLAAPLQHVADHLVDLLSAPPAPAAVTVLPEATVTTSGVGAETPLSASLPQCPAELAALARLLGDRQGRGAPLARSPDGLQPRLVELPSLGLHARHSKENAPVFALPPLGVLDSASRDQLSALAIRLLSPVIVIETPALAARSDSIRSVASSVVEALVRCRPHGPYNLLGWRLSTVLALEVQRQLEAVNKFGVAFLVHGDVGLVQRWAAACPPERRVQDVLTSADANAKQQVSLEDNPLARTGLEAVCRVLTAVAAHTSDVSSPFTGRVHAIYTSVDDLLSLNVNDSHVNPRTVAEINLGNLSLATYVNDKAAYSQLAGHNDIRLAIKNACRSDAVPTL